MYLVGWVGCPHCLFRWEICVEVDAPPLPNQRILIRCPNDNSPHRLSLTTLSVVPECPPDRRAMRLADFDSPDAPGPVRRWWRFWEW